jgi:hypothetical protein
MNNHTIRIGRTDQLRACNYKTRRNVTAALYAHCHPIHVQYQIEKVRWLFDSRGMRNGS